jgi:hypothetical protein
MVRGGGCVQLCADWVGGVKNDHMDEKRFMTGSGWCF